MFGCLRRLGCLVVICLLAVGGYLTRDTWYPRLRGMYPRVRGMVWSTPSATPGTWAPVTPDAAERGTRVALRLMTKGGPAYADMSPSEFVAWMLVPAMKILGTTAAHPEATARGDTLFVRAEVAINELGDPKSLGPLARVLDGRQPVMIGGRLEAVRPGLLAFHVTQLTVNDLRLPQPLIDQIVRRISVKARTDSLASGAVPLPVPASVADARVSKGRIVLYKVVP